MTPFMPMILGGITQDSKGQSGGEETQDCGASRRRYWQGGRAGRPEGARSRRSRFGIDFQWDHFDWSCDHYAKHGKMMPDDWQQQIGQHEAIFFGAIGWPATVPDHEALWGSLFKFRREFDQYINLRPVRLMPGVPSPLADRKPGEIDFSSFVKIPKVNIPIAAASCLAEPSAKWSSRKAYLPVWVQTAC